MHLTLGVFLFFLNCSFLLIEQLGRSFLVRSYSNRSTLVPFRSVLCVLDWTGWNGLRVEELSGGEVWFREVTGLLANTHWENNSKPLFSTNYRSFHVCSLYIYTFIDIFKNAFYVFVLFFNSGIVLDNSVRSCERTSVPWERRPALLPPSWVSNDD